MPDDFRLRYSEKYENTLVQDGKAKGRKAEKRRKEFTALTTNSIDNLFRSGRVLYGDEVTVYCNRVLDSLLVDEPQLRKELRIYTLRSNEVNAFSTHQGVILVTIGLISRLQTEAQLAFVLAHEIAHYVKKHSYVAFEYNKELFRDDLRNRRTSFDDKVLESARYSREAEFEADALGWDMYIRAGYNPEEAINTHDILLTSYLPIYDVLMDYTSLEDSFFKLPPDAKEFEFNPIMLVEDVDDSKHTHPNTHLRKEQLRKKFSTGSIINDQNDLFKLGKPLFDEVVLKARQDLLYNYLLVNKYVDALMLCDTWLESSNLDPTFLLVVKAYSYLGLQWKENHFDYDNINFKELQGNQISYYHLFNKLTKGELNVLVCRELWRIYQTDTTNEVLKQALYSGLLEMARTKRFKENSFKTSDAPKAKVSKSKSSCHTCEFAMKDPKFAGLEAVWSAVSKQVQTRVTKGPEEDEEEGEVEKEEVEMERLGVNKMVMLSPRFFGLDTRKSVDKRLKSSDSKQLFMDTNFVKYANELNIEVISLDSRENRKEITDDFNNYMLIMDWINEGSHYKKYKDRTFLTDDLKQFSDSNNVDYMAVGMSWNLIERRSFHPIFMAMSLITVYMFPVYLYWQLTPATTFAYVLYVINLESGKAEFVYQKEMYTMYQDYMLKAHMYHSLNQIRK